MLKRVLMSKTGPIALLVAYGPEVRAFVHSGFAEALARTHPVTVFTRITEARAYRAVRGLAIQPAPAAHEPRFLARMRSLANKTHQAHLASRGRRVWNHYLSGKPATPKRKFFDHFGRWLGCSAFGVRLTSGVEGFAARCWGSDAAWAETFREQGIGALICSSHASPHTLPVLQTAMNLGLKTMVINNSWKDVYTTPRVPAVPSRLAVWNATARQDLLDANARLRANQVVVLDSLHLAPFFTPHNFMSREEHACRMGLDASRPFICYTTAAPTAARNEDRIVSLLADVIARQALPGRPQLLVRLNPMEEGGRFQALQGRTDVAIHKPSWEWNRALDWCCALPEDVPAWVSTVAHAALNVSIPSTVTMEFGLLRKPVINVCFDLPSALPAAESNRRFWEADFYAGIRAGGGCVPAFSESDLLQELARAMGATAGVPSSANMSGGQSPVGAAVSLVEAVLAE